MTPTPEQELAITHVREDIGDINFSKRVRYSDVRLLLDAYDSLRARAQELEKEKELWDWLKKQSGVGLINDDNGHWAISGTGMQNVPLTDETCDIESHFFVEKADWKPSIKKALEHARKQYP